MKSANESEFNALKDRYLTISYDEILMAKQKFAEFFDAKQFLTGFGYQKTCMLCKEVALTDYITDEYVVLCYYCHWTNITKFKCHAHKNFKTYNAINSAKTPSELLVAYRERGLYMEKCQKKFNSLYPEKK